MASPPRPPAQHLTFLAQEATSAQQWELFALLRRLEALADDLPRIGRAKLPAQNIVDLAQTPSLGFASATMDQFEVRNGRAHVSGFWLGLLGPMGPMPIHLTEYAQYEARYAKKRPVGEFLDLLAGRMLQLFYRSWADAAPAAILDRPGDDSFGDYLSNLTGAEECVADDSAFPKRARLHYAALYASRRSATGIEDALSHLLGQPIRLLEYQPRWQTIATEDRTRLGTQYCTLGVDAIAGARIRSVTDAFRIVVRAGSLRDYESLLPTGKRFAIAAEALDAFAPSHLEWDIAVEIDGAHVRPVRLDGRARLGWTSWTSTERAGTVRQDAHLRRPGTPPQSAHGGLAQ